MKTISVLVFAACFATVGAHAQTTKFPERTVSLIVPAATGGSNTVVARLLAEKLQARWGQSVIVENKAGAATAIGTTFVARAKPDGHTLLVTAGPTFTMNPLLAREVSYKASDFEFIAYTGQTPLVLLTNPQSGYKSVSDVVAAAKAKPGALAYASFGAGSTPHFAGEAFAHAAGISLLHAPYKGSAPGMMDLIGNQIPLSIDTLTAALPQIQGKKVIPLALTSVQPSSQLPGVPTIASSGYAGFDFSTWFLVAAPKGTPPELVSRIAADLKEILATPELERALQANGIDNAYRDGRAVRELIGAELARNKTLMQQAGIKPNE